MSKNKYCGMVFFTVCLFWHGAISSVIAGTVARQELGKATLALVNEATQVEVVASIKLSKNPKYNGLVYWGPFQELKRRIHSKAYLAQLRLALLDDKNYSMMVACIPHPDPGITFTLTTGKQRVEVSPCFDCGMLFVYTYDSQGKLVHNVEGVIGSPLWLMLTKKAFPYNPKIQKLR